MTVLIQRPLKGSRISSFYPVKSLPPLSALDSAFQLQEYISLLIRLDIHDVDAITALPGRDSKDRGTDGDGAAPTAGEGADEKEGEGKTVAVDEACWVYEQLRCVSRVWTLSLSLPHLPMLTCGW